MKQLLKILFILLVAVSLKPAAYHVAEPSDIVVVNTLDNGGVPVTTACAPVSRKSGSSRNTPTRGNIMQLTAGRRPSWTDSVRLSVCRLPGLALQMQDIRFR